MSSTSKLSEEYRELMAGTYQGDVYQLIHRFGEMDFFDAEPTLEALLSDPNPRLRYSALNVLALYWRRESLRGTFERLATDDPDREVRRLAVASLASILAGTRDKRGLSFLLSFIGDAPYPDIRDTAYDAMRAILGYRTYDPLARELRWPEEVDWKIVEEARALVDEA